ncbi:MAG: C39 family peptidase [Nocardioides sp.]
MRLPFTGTPTGTMTRTSTSAVTVLILAGCYVAAVTPGVANAADARQIHYTQWDSGAEFATGQSRGLTISQGRLVLDGPATPPRSSRSVAYERSSWESPWTSPGFAFTELIPSWSARTPGNSLVEIRVRGRDTVGALSSWDLMARWASGDRYLKRSTAAGQKDDLAKVNVDTWQATTELTSYQVRVTLARRAGSSLRPSVDMVGAVASRLPGDATATSAPGVGRGIVLDVPRYSQMVHEGHYPQWNGGGEAWCSPTSTSMVLGYYDKLPAPSAYGWVPEGHVDPWVDYAARMTFDYDYDGTGNWPFNTAFAAPRVGKGFVTRLRSLREAERFIAAGIPLVASISFGTGALDGAPMGSTAGHLLVIVGFTKSGDVVVNDPASHTRRGVRRTYDRAQFEQAWLPTSGGTVYVIHDAAHPLPAGGQTNW